MNILVTGAAGFIGSHFVDEVLGASKALVVVLDALTYAGNMAHLRTASGYANFRFVHGSVLDRGLMVGMLGQYEIDTVVHFAAETHVDRSIAASVPFVETNVLGTAQLLEAILEQKKGGREIPLIHVSTDEVYGALAPAQAPFNESCKLNPTSPYAASKAAADYLVLSFVRTHGICATIVRCCNVYGPRQYPEKFIPVAITGIENGLPVPVYGNGTQSREWMYVTDTAKSIWRVVQQPLAGEIINIGSGFELQNFALLSHIAREMKKEVENVYQFVQDRPGHDVRYAMNSGRFRELYGYTPAVCFDDGIRETVKWYRANNKSNYSKGLV